MNDNASSEKMDGCEASQPQSPNMEKSSIPEPVTKKAKVENRKDSVEDSSSLAATVGTSSTNLESITECESEKKNIEESFPLLDLPLLIQLMVMKNLSLKMLIRLSTTCRYLKELIFDSSEFWSFCELRVYPMALGSNVGRIEKLEKFLNKIPTDSIKHLDWYLDSENLSSFKSIIERYPHLDELTLGGLLEDQLIPEWFLKSL